MVLSLKYNTKAILIHTHTHTHLTSSSIFYASFQCKVDIVDNIVDILAPDCPDLDIIIVSNL